MKASIALNSNMYEYIRGCNVNLFPLIFYETLRVCVLHILLKIYNMSHIFNSCTSSFPFSATSHTQNIRTIPSAWVYIPS